MNSLDLAKQSIAANDFAAAISHAETALLNNANDPDALWVSALAHFNSGQMSQACERARAVARLIERGSPNRAQPLMLLGMAASQAGNLAEARLAFEELRQQLPGNAGVSAALSRIAYAQGDRDSAEAFAREFFATLPSLSSGDLASPLLQLGKTLYECSLFARAEDASQWLAEVRGLVVRLDLKKLEADVSYQFGMAKLNEIAGDYQSAMEHYRSGNGLARAQSRYRIEEDIAVLDQTRQSYGKAYFEAVPVSAPVSDQPRGIFILGMPRSGSSLIEQILAAHPEVEPCGERFWLHESFRDALEAHNSASGHVPRPLEFDSEFLGEVRSNYYQRAGFAPGVQCFTDKMPGNIYKLGLLLKAFPDARVIITERDKFATVMSCFTTAFASGLGFTESLSDCARMYDETHSLAKHWVAHAGRSIQVLDYQELVTEPRRTVEALLEFCDLDWHPACLEPHRVDRAVGTSSNMQVREPIYRRADKRWDAFRDYLGSDAELFPAPE